MAHPVLISQLIRYHKTSHNHRFLLSLPRKDGSGGPGFVAVWDDAHAIGFQAGVVHLDGQVMLGDVSHDLVPLSLVEEAHVLAVGAHPG